jgi:hypothetical protein
MRVSCWYFGPIYIMVNQINSTPSGYLLFLYDYTPLILNSLQDSTLYYIHVSMGCFSILHSLTFSFPLLPPIVPLDRLANTVLFSLSLYMYLYICLTYRSSFHIWWKTYDLLLFEPGLLCLTRSSPDPSIYLQTT